MPFWVLLEQPFTFQNPLNVFDRNFLFFGKAMCQHCCHSPMKETENHVHIFVNVGQGGVDRLFGLFGQSGLSHLFRIIGLFDLSCLSSVNETNQINQIDGIDQTDRTDQTDETDSVFEALGF
jgi:hypothetical protein